MNTLTRFKSPLRYPGGKQKAIEQIAALLPSRVGEYREPLVGGGSVCFHARTTNMAGRYWINDKFEELFAFWQAVQDKDICKRLVIELEELRNSFSSVEEIKEYFLRARKETQDDSVEGMYRKAFLFFFFNRVTFSGTTRAGGFSAGAALKRFTASSIERLSPMPEALADVKISNLDFVDVIKEDGEDVFIFLDPPYFTATRLYGKDGSLHAFDHWKLAKILSSTRHRFLITYDDCPEIRELYKFAEIRPFNLQYGMNNCNSLRTSKVGNEIFISNY